MNAQPQENPAAVTGVDGEAWKPAEPEADAGREHFFFQIRRDECVGKSGGRKPMH